MKKNYIIYIRYYKYNKLYHLSCLLSGAKRKVLILLFTLLVVLGTSFACNDNSTSISSSSPFFPVQKAGLASMEALLEGRLELDNGYLRVKYFDDNYLLIWPHGFSLRTEGEEIQVIDSNGQVFACVGDKIRVGGGEKTGEKAKEFIEKYIVEQPLPDDCLGPYWVIGEVVYNGSSLGTESGDLESSGETNEEAELFFAEDYAKIHGVTVDEAIKRLKLQDIAGELGEELTTKEADTLAGYWIEHIPKFKLVILFTRDAEDIIKPYLQKYKELADIIEVGTAKLSLVELENIQEKVSTKLENLGITTDSEVDVYKNCVKFYVVDRAQIDRAVSGGKLVLPDCVEVITVDSLAKPEAEN